jgi:hypothetical protein
MTVLGLLFGPDDAEWEQAGVDLQGCHGGVLLAYFWRTAHPFSCTVSSIQLSGGRNSGQHGRRRL